MVLDKFRNIIGLKSVTIIGTANIVGSAITAIFWLYLANLLGETDYGEIGYLIAIGGIVSNLTIVGGSNVITVLTAKNINIQPPVYVFSIIASIISAIILFVSFENIGLSSIVIAYVLYNLVMGDLLGRKMYKNYSYYFLIQKILFVVLAFSLYSAIGSIGILLGIALSYLIFIKRFYFTLKEVQFDLSLLKTKSSTLINFYMLEVSGKFKGQIDKLIIVPLFGFAFLGNYFLSIQIVYMLTIIPQIVMQYTLPEDASGSETKKLKIIAVVISIFLALISSIFGPTIITFLFPEFQDSVDLIPIMSLVIIPITISLMYESKFLGQEKGKFLLIGHIITISILVPGIYLLGEYFGAVGIASALLLSLSTYSLYLFIINRVISR